MRNNADWLRGVHLMHFLRDTGKHFTVSYMLQKESVQSRLESGISYTEFSYMLVQAYDFWHLFRTEGCELQMGGSDQWGNITAGAQLVDKREHREVHGIVFPLITTASGAKFGKSETGNLWLDPERTKPYAFYQFWLNTDDRDVERYLKLFTFLRLDRIQTAMEEHGRDPGRRTAQRLLAREPSRRSRPARRCSAGDVHQAWTAMPMGPTSRLPTRSPGRSSEKDYRWWTSWCVRGWHPPRRMPGAGSRARGFTSMRRRCRT
jgi:tyrosyl-tRNA synthetase